MKRKREPKQQETPRYSAADLAKASGLSRPFVYHLMKKGLIRPTGPTWEAARFDAGAVQMAVILGDLQRRGIGPMTAVHAVDGALAEYARRITADRIRPLEGQMAELTGRVWAMLGKASSTGSIRAVERELLTTAKRYVRLKSDMDKAAGRLGVPPQDDPSWQALDRMFGSRRQRDQFIALLLKSRGALRGKRQ